MEDWREDEEIIHVPVAQLPVDQDAEHEIRGFSTGNKTHVNRLWISKKNSPFSI